MIDPVLRVTGLRRCFGTHVAVDDISLDIRPGETLGLLGPNGAGKTTTISMIVGLLVPDAGSVEVAGVSMGGHPIRAKRSIGLVPQDLAIYPELSARDNLLYFGRLQGLSGARLKERVAHVLEVVGLGDRSRGPSKTFSGGMKRRLNIAVGLLHEPALLVLDEPTVGVDPQSRHAILTSVEQLSTAGMAVLYTTHYMEEAERLCDRIAIVDDGAVRAEGTRQELVDLVGGTDTVILTGSGQLGEAALALASLPVVDQVHESPTALRLVVRREPGSISDIVAAGSEAGMTLSDVEITRPDLESVFLHLTGKALRD
ncbi:export ABC transporter ATP-binding protein [Serinicoccus sp. CNJ-927]|nr:MULTISPECIES: ABC transporter ATP-binding protein [unclassified Serinicoccus]OLT17874.1 export ABC transporter ATP-binding protein [Serinicoccus sp. CUA-874]OLT39590.1 export ABC transporter ATP-binding protein [Serinicoccus sp. CNJ-927]